MSRSFARGSLALLVSATALLAMPDAFAQQVPLPGSNIQKWVDPMPVFPARVDATQPLEVRMAEVQQRVLPAAVYDALPAPFYTGTFVWGYGFKELGPDGRTFPVYYPGFTVVAKRGVPTTMTFLNDLVNPFLQSYPGGGGAPIFAVDATLNWADPLNQGTSFAPYDGPVPVCVHLHGGEVPSAFDGGPDAWFTPNTPGNQPITGPGYVTNVYTYPNGQEAATIWMHDHALGITRLTPHMGMAAFYFLQDPAKEPQNLPTGEYDQEIVIQDRLFDTNGQLIFPAVGDNPDVHPFWLPEFFGDTILVNGKSWPYFEVEPRRYRLRLLNGSNARFYNLAFDNPRVKVWQIATDAGYLDAPVALKSLVLAPGERAELIVDFRRAKRESTILTNNAKSPYPVGTPADPRTVGQILQFRIEEGSSVVDHSCDPGAGECVLRPGNPIVRLNPDPAQVPTRRLTLNEEQGANGPLTLFMNNTELGDLGVEGTLDEKPRVGSTEIWEIVNISADSHPIHLHLVDFQVLSRQALQTSKYISAYDASFPGGLWKGVTYPPGVLMPGFGPPLAYGNCLPGTICGGNPDPTPFLQGTPSGPYPYEQGWKDTVQSNPGEVVRIAVRWAPVDTPVDDVQPGQNRYPFDPSAQLGVLDDGFGYPGGPGYVWHCHIIDHEDNEMMRRYEVTP
jgi:FtsP/CotA-like multicopper oxidase with cupredoxin domain